MPVAWPDLRDLAKNLISDAACNEAQVRASIGRAYYAAFHALEPLCRVVPGDPPKHGSDGLGHGQIIRRLKDWHLLANKYAGLSHTVFAARAKAQDLESVLEARMDADYDLTLVYDIESAKLQLKRAQEILNFAVQAEAEFLRLNIPR